MFVSGSHRIRNHVDPTWASLAASRCISFNAVHGSNIPLHVVTSVTTQDVGPRSAAQKAPDVLGTISAVGPRRIGIFGGTFDPPHVGHLVVAVNVGHAVGLDEVRLVVANEPWQKVAGRAITPAAERLAMVKAAVADVEGLAASDVEICRGGTSYTIDTVDELEATGDVEAVVVLGSDAAAGVTSWRRAEELRRRARIVVVDRPGATGSRPPPGWDWVNVEAPRLEVSSTDLRARLVDGRPLDFLITAPVLDAIRRRRIYPLGERWAP